MTSHEDSETLISMAHRKETPYQLAIVKGTPSFSGLWVYKDDHSDVRILGTMAKVLPELFSLASVQQVIRAEWNDELKATSALRAYERATTVTVQPTQGNPEKPFEFQMPKWTEMREGIAIPAIPRGHQMKDPNTGEMGGYQPERNPTFKKFTTRSMRPVVDFDTCIKCTLCWLQCPDSVFDVTPDGLYDANWRRVAAAACARRSARCPAASPWSTRPSSQTTTASGRRGSRTRKATRAGSRRRLRTPPTAPTASVTAGSTRSRFPTC